MNDIYSFKYIFIIIFSFISFIFLFVNKYGKHLSPSTVHYTCLLENCHIRINGICDNCFIGTMESESTVVLGQMELIHLSYWNKWNWLNCRIDTNGIDSTVVLTQLSLCQLSYWVNSRWTNCRLARCRDATTSGQTTVGSTTVGSRTVDSIPFGTIQQLCQYDSWINSICLNMTVGSIPFVLIRQMYQVTVVTNSITWRRSSFAHTTAEEG